MYVCLRRAELRQLLDAPATTSDFFDQIPDAQSRGNHASTRERVQPRKRKITQIARQAALLHAGQRLDALLLRPIATAEGRVAG